MKTEVFHEALESLGLELSSDQLDRFERFKASLYEANAVMNLTRIPIDECWRRHFLDSLLFQDLIPENAKVLDIGTGPGFPSWPLAWARQDLDIIGLDSNAKMLGFLKSVALPNLHTVNSRAEEWSQRETFDFVTGRAVAPLSAQLEVSASFCKIGSLVVPMRAQSDLDAIFAVDIVPLGLQLDRVIERPLPGTDVIRVFPIYRKARPSQPGFPRRWAEIKRAPL